MRLTLDFDNVMGSGNMFNIIRADGFLKEFSFKQEYYVSARKQGIHCIYWIRKKAIVKVGKFKLRFMFGDDLKRLLLDMLRQETGDVTDVLWDEKGKQKNRKFNNLWDCFKYIEKVNK